MFKLNSSGSASRLITARLIPLLLLCGLTSPVTAKTTAKMNVKPGKYHKVTKPAYGPTYPVPGPVIKVYTEGSSTKYTHIADKHKKRKALMEYTASCSNKGKFSSLSFTVGSGSASKGGGSGFSSGKLWIETDYSSFSKIKPAKLCNHHAKTLSLEKNKPLEKIVQKGFSIYVPDVLTAQGTAFCSAALLGKGDVESDSAKLGAYVVCEPNPKARTPRKTTKTKKPDNDPGKATTIFEVANFVADKKNHTGKCPTSIKYTGKIKANAKGSVQYQWIGNGNYKSPVKTLTFNEAGSKAFNWTRMIKPADPAKQFTTANNKKPNQINGWMALKVIYKLKNKMAHTKKTWTSKQKDFTITCAKPGTRLQRK